MKKFAYSAAAFSLPLLAAAQANVNDITDVGEYIIYLINTLAIPVIFALAFVVFVWGVFVYFVQGAKDEEKRDTGKQFILYGLIGFFVMISVWGLVNILRNSVNLDDRMPDYPEVRDN